MDRKLEIQWKCLGVVEGGPERDMNNNASALDSEAGGRDVAVFRALVGENRDGRFGGFVCSRRWPLDLIAGGLVLLDKAD